MLEPDLKVGLVAASHADWTGDGKTQVPATKWDGPDGSGEDVSGPLRSWGNRFVVGPGQRILCER